MANTREAVNGERIRRILEQAERHGGLKRIDVPFASAVEGEGGRRARQLPFEQLEFPWALDPTWGPAAAGRSHRH